MVTHASYLRSNKFNSNIDCFTPFMIVAGSNSTSSTLNTNSRQSQSYRFSSPFSNPERYSYAAFGVFMVFMVLLLFGLIWYGIQVVLSEEVDGVLVDHSTTSFPKPDNLDVPLPSYQESLSPPDYRILLPSNANQNHLH
ncbi:hypothetical protein BC833DRAFT_653007 [Globomyces pollinis-pini]|nr:hypothetical protein BC833DRAFT_653007 [Globomyces pollinis-pini]